MISCFLVPMALAMASSVGNSPDHDPAALDPSFSLSPPTPLASSLSLSAAPAQVPARMATGQFNYDYIEVLGSFGDLRGVLAEGSYQIQDRWLIVGKAGYLTKSSVDFRTFSAGVGYVLPIQQDLDFVGTGEVEYGDVDVDLPGGGSASDDDLGVRARGGVRFQASPEVELFGGLGVRTIFDNDLRVDAGGLYILNERVSFVGRVEVDDDTQISVGARFGF